MNILVAIPCHDYVNAEFIMSLLRLHSKDTLRYGMTVATMVQDARNILAENAIKYGYDRVMWLDSDMIVDPDIVDRLSDDLDEGKEFVSGLYFTRKADRRPVLFNRLEHEETDDGHIIPHADFYYDYPRDTLFRVAGCGFGACMMNTDVLQKVVDRYGQPFALMPGFGEDISFCKRCEGVGIDVWCDSRIKCGHIGTRIYTEADYK